MKKTSRFPRWIVWTAVLASLGAFFRFAMAGYDFIGYALFFAAALIPAYRFGGKAINKFLTVFLAAGVLYFIIVEIPIVSAARTDPDPGAAYIIVLGAGVNGSEPSLSLADRLEATLEYLVEYPDCTAIVSGGRGAGENISEADCMYGWLTERGVDGARVIREERASNTRENFQYSFEIIRSRGGDPNGAAFVSSEYHLCRAKLIAARLGVGVKAVAAHTSYPLMMANYFIREAFAVTYLRAFG